MKTRNLFRQGRGAAAVVFGLILLAALAVGVRAASAPAGSGAAAPDPAATPTPQPTPVAYYGQVKLARAVAGVYSDTLPAADPAAPGPELGQIDLGFMLTTDAADQTKVRGYVDLDTTMVFTATAPGATTGPAIYKGKLDGKQLSLESVKVSELLFKSLPASDPSQRTIYRQFRLDGAPVAGQPGFYSGEYRETLWGYAPYPITVIGAFNLRSGAAPPPQQTIYLPLLMRK